MMQIGAPRSDRAFDRRRRAVQWQDLAHQQICERWQERSLFSLRV